MVKEANKLSTAKRLINALGGGHTGKSNLKFLQDTFKSMPPSYYSSDIPEGARWIMENYLEPGLDRMRLNGVRMSRDGIFSVLDPSGRLAYSNRLSRAKNSAHVLQDPETIAEGWARGYEGSAKDPFQRFLMLPGEVKPGKGIVGPMRDKLNKRRAYTAAEYGPNYARNFYNEAIDFRVRTPRGAELFPTAMYSPVAKRIARGRMGALGQHEPFTSASVQMLPGETPQAAVLRDLRTRLIPGTRLSSANGKSIIGNTPLGLTSTGQETAGEIGQTARSRVRDLVRATSKAEGLGATIPPIEKLNSFASPLGVSTFAANNNGAITYAPNVLMHEFGHVYNNYPYFIRSSHIPGGPTVSGLDRAYSKTPRSLKTYENRGYKFISDPEAVRKDPIRALRSMHPRMLEEVNADVNAFGSDIGKWPQDIRGALGSYMSHYMLPYGRFAPKNIDKLGLKNTVLRYRDLSNAYMDALRM